MRSISKSRLTKGHEFDLHHVESSNVDPFKIIKILNILLFGKRSHRIGKFNILSVNHVSGQSEKY